MINWKLNIEASISSHSLLEWLPLASEASAAECHAYTHSLFRFTFSQRKSKVALVSWIRTRCSAFVRNLS